MSQRKSQIPKFMKGDEHLGKEEFLQESPEFWEARALLIGQYGNEIDQDRLFQMLHSTTIAQAQTIAEWRSLCQEQYPDITLEGGEMTRAANGDVPARAFMLKQAILRLFKLCSAPAPMHTDLELLLDSLHGKNLAPARARVQAARLANPEASWKEICEIAEADYHQAMADKNAGDIIHDPTSIEQVKRPRKRKK